jgi:tRNA G18 (ribose-2'-O)-methylase SpoU
MAEERERCLAAGMTACLTKPFKPYDLFAAVEGLTNAENLGALVRNCAAFQVQALIVGETAGSPYLRRAVRNSMGTIFQLPVIEPPSLVATLRELRAQGVRCIAAHPRAHGKLLGRADFTIDCCIVFGSEGYGLTAEALEACDEAVSIPMAPRIDSLNVGSAAAAFLYEANRQRALARAKPEN